jgi:hypothetical protein
MHTVFLAIQAIVAFVIASLIVWIELVTSKYPRTISLFYNKSKCLWIYPIIYGLMAGLLVLGYQSLSSSGAFRIERPSEMARDVPQSGDRLPWWIGIAVGVSAKALLNIRLFSFTSGAETVPVGTESIVRLFEPWLLSTIQLDEFNAVREFIEKRAAIYRDVEDVRRRISTNIPDRILSEAQREAMEADIGKYADVKILMDIYLRAFGPGTFRRVFPDQKNPRRQGRG